MDASELIRAARKNIAAGMPPFPHVPDGEASLGGHGFKDETTDPAGSSGDVSPHFKPIMPHGWRPAQVVQLIEPQRDESVGGYRWEHPGGFEASLPTDIDRAFEEAQPPEPKPFAASKRKSRFGGRTASEGENLPPITYWDCEKTLPRIPGEGCVGYLIGESGTHKTGTAIMMALDAIEMHGARVLYIAAEGALGVEKVRVPAARKTRGMSLEKLDRHWRVESETFNLLSETDRAELIEAYRKFGPNIVVIDVMTLVVPGADINTQQTATAIRDGAGAIAVAFGATVVLVHHPSRRGVSAGGSGSALFKQQAYFELHTSYKDGVVRVWVDKMKDGEAQRDVRYKHVDDEAGVPVIRAMTAAEQEELKGKRPPKPGVAAENATGAAAIAKLERDAPDVLNALRKITEPKLLREIAPMLEATADGADAKDEDKGTPYASRIRRLNRLIGDAKSPGILAPFTAPRTGGKTSPHRLMPIAPTARRKSFAQNEPSDAPAS
jgi:hypothetical protein